jgi:phenylpropionate dioxygenase-like ring-hydroxylating dioxygenase large terminal subunit
MSSVQGPRQSNHTERNYPRNCWWVAGTAQEVGRKPIGRWLLDTPVVLYRNEAGAVIALDERCPHRWAPLSSGYLEGDNIVCPYHGARFAPNGRCVKFPTQERLPADACVRSFAIAERGPFVWIWMGEDAARDAAPLPPDFPWARDPTWTVVAGSYTFEANYMLLHENVLDLTHFNYVHAKTFQTSQWPAPRYRVDGNRVGFEDTYIASELDEATRILLGLNDPYAIQTKSSCWFVTPALHVAEGTLHRRPNPDLPERSVTSTSHMVTPASPTRTHYWWIIGTNRPITAEGRLKRAATFDAAFTEDRNMLESIQRMIDQDPRGRQHVEVTFRGDMGGLQARRALARLLAAEGAGTANPPETAESFVASPE